ncbi:peptide ABC transporter substrate-binding protein [bacterium]|nr:peptide ABC transporter substrate-binding protein [bacterium]
MTTRIATNHLAFVLCLSLLAGGLTACGGSKVKDSGLKILHLGNGSEPKDLDPAIVTGMLEFHIISSLVEGLVTLDPNDLAPVPAAAKSWEISEDHKTYTFHMRPESRWSNGDPVTSEDFAYSWRRLLDPQTAAEYAYQAYYIKNGRAFNEGKLKDVSQVGLATPDTLTLVVTLESPTPFFLSLLNHHSLYPVHRRTVETHGPKWTLPEHHVGNGPFRLKSWVMNSVIVVERSPTYWDAKTVGLDEIHFYPTENDATEEKQFRAGKLHVSYTVPLERIPYWRDEEKQLYNQFPAFGTYYYELNVTRGPLKDKRVRKALALSIDRDAIVTSVTRGGQIPAYAYTPPKTAGFTPIAHLKYDPEEARKLLAAAGYPGGKGFPKLDILYNTQEGHRKIAEAFQQMWKKELGIDVGLFNQEWKVFLNTKKNLDFDLARAGWFGDYPDPNTFLDMYVTGGGNNNTGFSHAEYDELIRKAAQTMDREERFRYFQRCEDILAEEVPIIPIYTYTRIYLKRPEVRGWSPNVMDFRSYKALSLDEG